MPKLVLSEIAERLNLNIETFDRWIKQGKIPVKRKGNFGIFNESELNKWAEKQRISFRATENEAKQEETLFSCTLLTAVKAGGLIEGIKGESKEDVIQDAVNRIKGIPDDLKSEIHIKIMKREKLASTGIGRGVAIPHPRSPLKNGLSHPMIVTCFLDNPMDFYSVDSRPVFVIFIILTPSIETHLNLLSKLSFCLRDDSFIKFLEKRPDFQTFLDIIETMELSIEERGI